jgi:hypothetical protein
MAKTLPQSMSLKLSGLADSAAAWVTPKKIIAKSTNEAGRLLKTHGTKGAAFPEPQNVIENQ